MPKTYYWEYTVVGNGQFPADMLRYDAAYPYDQTNVGIAPHRYSETGWDTRKVNLRSLHEPTVDRWLSFGWRVENIQKRG